MTQLPLIHLNGTSGKVLVREYADAVTAIDDAIAAVGNITVHPRDYYPIDDHAAHQALNEHHIRLTRLQEVRNQLHEIYYCLLEQMLTRQPTTEEA